MFLKGGMVLPLEPVLLALRLESEGFRFEVSGDGALLVAPGARLSLADRQRLRRWRHHLVMLARYEAGDDASGRAEDRAVASMESGKR